MRLFYTCFFLFSFCLHLDAQVSSDSLRSGFRVTAGAGLTLGTDDLVGAGLGLRLGVDYQQPLSHSIALSGGFGLQQRNTVAGTAENIPCDFPLGDKVISYSDWESYRTHELEAFIRIGADYHRNRFSIGLAVLPAYRISYKISYTAQRDFDFDNRPDNVVDVTINSGERIFLVTGQDRSVQYANDFNLQAEVNLQYAITPRTRVGIAFQPMLTNNDVEFGDQLFCGIAACELVELSETIFSARVHTTFLSITRNF